MASLRIVRMSIPLNFTMEFLEDQILEVVNANSCSDSARVRMTVYRNDGGFYAPNTNTVSYSIFANHLDSKSYILSDNKYDVDLYKDFL